MTRYVPGEEYSHYKEGDIYYAERVSTGERFAIGWKSIDPVNNTRHDDPQSAESLYYDMVEQSLYEEIRQAAKTNNTLQAEMERVKQLYYLIRDNKVETVAYHPV